MCYSQYPLPASSTGPADQMLQGPLACRVSSNGLQVENDGLGSCDYFSEDAHDDLLDLSDLLDLDDLDGLLEDPLRQALPNDCADTSSTDNKQGASSRMSQPSPPIQGDLPSSPFAAAATTSILQGQVGTKKSSAAQLLSSTGVALGSPQSPSTAALLQRYWQLRQLEAGCGSAPARSVQTAARVLAGQPAKRAQASAWPASVHLSDAASHGRQAPATVPAASTSDPKWRLRPFATVQPVLRPAAAAAATVPSCQPLPVAGSGTQHGSRGLGRAFSEPRRSQSGSGPVVQPPLASAGCYRPAAGMTSGLAEGLRRGQQAKRPRVETLEPPRKHGSKATNSEELASLQLQNALLRRQVATLRETMRLWCTQGFVSQKQAFTFLAQLAAAKA